MGIKPGNFKFHDSIIPAEELEQQPGKFGYINWWAYLRMDGKGKLFVEADGVIDRDASSTHPAILVRATKGGGLEIELVGGDVLSPGAPSDKRPSKTAIPVKRIKAGGKWYKRWDDEIRYHSIMTMPIGESHQWFIERKQISTFGDPLNTSNLSGVKKKGGPTRVPIRRLGKDQYEVQMPRRGWLPLKLD